MAENMPANSEGAPPDDLFRNVEATLKQLRAAATPSPMPPDSWWKRIFDPAPPSSHQSEFNTALVDALTQLSDALRKTAVSQGTRLAQVAEELSKLRALPENLDAFREHSVRVETELRSVAANVRALQERSAALEAELAQAREEQSNKMQRLTAEQGDIQRELSDRIQHLLDEQRVCIRQLSLQASEEAVLADRARRATELKLEELARRVPPPPP